MFSSPRMDNQNSVSLGDWEGKLTEAPRMDIAEALALWQRLQIARTCGIIDITMLGDSRVLIKALAENSIPTQLHLRQMIKKILTLASTFLKIEFFHILREHNGKVDCVANRGIVLGFRVLEFNGDSAYFLPS